MNDCLRRLVLLGLDQFENAHGDDQKILETSKLHEKLDQTNFQIGRVIDELRTLGNKQYQDSEVMQMVLNVTYAIVKDVRFPGADPITLVGVEYGDYVDLHIDFANKQSELKKVV